MGYQYKFNIAGIDYGMTDVKSVKHISPLFDTLSVGNACSAELEITFWPNEQIPTMAKIIPYIQEADGAWKQLGVFWTDTRSAKGTALNIVAYDAMMKAENEWLPDDSLEFPMTMAKAVEAIATAMDVEVDPRNAMNSSYTIDYPANGQTMRETLMWIAGAHAGNWIITAENKLRLVPLFSSATADNNHDIEKKASNIEFYDELGPITAVVLSIDSETEIVVGNTSGYTLEIVCPYGTQTMAQNILAAVSGYTYKGFRATGAMLDPSAELGDRITVDGVISFLAYRNVAYGPAHMSEVAAPGESTLAHEYSYRSPSERQMDKKLGEMRSSISKTAEEIRLQVEGAENEISVLKQTAGMVNISVTDDNGTLSTMIDAKTWQAMYQDLVGDTKSGFYFDFTLGRFVYDGTGIFRSEEGESYIEVENDGLSLYADSGNGDGVVKKIHVGFTTAENVDYPYILLGNAGTPGQAALVKKFWNGLFIGNSYALDASGDFTPKANYAGIFIDTVSRKTYVVNGTEMQNIYTGEAIARFA